MVEAQKYRIEQEMTNLVNELDKSYLRNMQVSYRLGSYHRKLCNNTYFLLIQMSEIIIIYLFVIL